MKVCKNSHIHGYVYLKFLLLHFYYMLCLYLITENFKVVGPAASLVVEAGVELVLPCSLQPNISAVNMMVEWIRTDLSGSDTLVHLYKDHKDTNDKQIRSYRGRTALFKEELQKGNASLKLSAVQPSDQGVYQCTIKSESWFDDVTVHVEVEGLLKVVGPAAPLVAEAGEDLVLPCSITPSVSAEDMMVEWIRLELKDTQVHLYKGYQDRNQKQMESYRGRTALFKEELKKGNTSLKLSALQPSDEGVYQCYIEYGTWADDVMVYVEVKGKGFHAWKIAIICISVFAIMFSAFTAYILKEKFLKNELSPIQCSVIAYTRLQSENVKKELDLNKFNTSEKGYRKLIPAITKCKKARFAGCNLTEQSLETLSSALQTENSFLRELDLSNSDLKDLGLEKLSAGLKSSNCKLQIFGLEFQNFTIFCFGNIYPIIENFYSLCYMFRLLIFCRLAMCNLSTQSCNTLKSVLQTETSSLKELDLSNNDLYDSGVEMLSAELKSSSCKLQTLRLAACKLSTQSCSTLQSVLQTETSFLKELDLSRNDLQDSGVEKLSAGLKSSNCKLEILRLAWCNLREKTIENLGSALQSNTWPLKELDISKNNLQDSGMKTFSDGLQSSQCKLEILRLAICNFTVESGKSLISALKTKISFLKELDLSSNELQDSAVDLLSAGLDTADCKLETLKLALCNLPVNTCENVGSLLKLENSSLKELDLSNNDLQNSGVELISAGLQSSDCKLEILRLSGCMITEEGCSSLALALSSNPSHLKELDLTYNYPGESGEKLLSVRLEDPQCALNTLRLEHGGDNRIKPGLKK
ncbi:hypothetical protein NFI96_018634 [Prochilodus magdalenae]|nr:hypothetical protein NFI96_018634 [Prochilodus magdalenae]